MQSPPILDFPKGLAIPRRPDQSLWRYLPANRFIEQLSRSELYLPAARFFDQDPLEGSYPDANRRMQDAFFRQHPVPKEWEDRVRNAYRMNLDWVYVSCWFMQDHESALMWRAYGDCADAVVVKTTYSKLSNAVPSDVLVYAVRYIDYSLDCIPDGHSLYPFFFKSKEYADERELRVLVQHFPDREGRRIEAKTSCRLDFDWASVLLEVRPSRKCSTECRAELGRAMKEAGCAFGLTDSALARNPRF